MNIDQRNERNNQSDNGGNEKPASSGRNTPATERLDQSQQSGTQSGSRQGERESNDVAGGLPKSPGTHHLAADQDMDDDTGLSNRANRQSAEPDQSIRQIDQSNVGRRDDGTPD